METARKKVAPIEDRWMSVLKAAAALGCSRHWVLVSIAKRELESGYVAERIVVSRESVEALKAARDAASAANAVSAAS